jgi:F-type H+-transporting ATPase subunit epsilon
MHLYIYSLEKKIYEGESLSVTLPTTSGEITVLPEHIPLVTTLSKGTVKFKTSSEAREEKISGGFAEIKSDGVILLVK